MADNTVDDMLCRWAEQKYDLPPNKVTRVEFQPGTQGPYSDVTPDIDSVLVVYLWNDQQLIRTDYISYTNELIREIMALAANEATHLRTGIETLLAETPRTLEDGVTVMVPWRKRLRELLYKPRKDASDG